MTGGSDSPSGEWLTIAEAAERLGVKPIAIRARIRRGTLRVRPASRENDRRTKVWIDASAGAETGVDGATNAGFSAGASDSTIKALEAHLATLREQVAREREAQERTQVELADERRKAQDLADQLDQARRDRLAEAERHRTERDRLAQELADERQHGRELAGRLDQLHERHRADLEALRAELAAERGRPWWRRVRRQ